MDSFPSASWLLRRIITRMAYDTTAISGAKSSSSVLSGPNIASPRLGGSWRWASSIRSLSLGCVHDCGSSFSGTTKVKGYV